MSARRWLVLACAMGAQVGAAGLTLGLPALGPHLRAQFHLSLSGLGALLAAPTVGYALTMFVWGSLADRRGERGVMAAGLGASAAVLVAAGAAGSAWTLGLGLAVAGGFGACAPAASGRAVVRWFPPRERGMALGLRHTAPMVGGALGAALLPVAARAGATTGAMWLLAGFAAVGAVCALGVTPGDGAGDAHAPVVRERHPAVDGLVWLLAGGGALVIVGQAVLLRFQPEYLHSARGWSQDTAALVLSLTLLAAALARIAAGVISDRHGRRIRVLAGQALGAGVLVVGASALLGLPAQVAAVLLVGAATLTMAGNGVAYAAIAEVAPLRTGAALGLYATVLIVVVSVAPALFGLLAGAVPWGVAFALVGVFPLLGAGVLWHAERVFRRRGVMGAPVHATASPTEPVQAGPQR
ncbi:MAG: MFS transporter [Thermoleophilia bacterium]